MTALSKLSLAISASALLISIIVTRLTPDPERAAWALFEEECFAVSPNLGPLHKFKVLQTGKGANGKAFAAHDARAPGAGAGPLRGGCMSAKVAPPCHTHLKQKESFTIGEGNALFVADGETSLATAGDKLVIHAGQRRALCHAPSATGTFSAIFTLEPAMDAHLLFTNFVGIHCDSHVKPSPAHLMCLVCAHGVCLAGAPRPTHELTCWMLPWVAPLLGC